MKFEFYKNFIYAKYGLNFNVPAGAVFFFLEMAMLISFFRKFILWSASCQFDDNLCFLLLLYGILFEFSIIVFF